MTEAGFEKSTSSSLILSDIKLQIFTRPSTVVPNPVPSAGPLTSAVLAVLLCVAGAGTIMLRARRQRTLALSDPGD
jgi:hypothetical protein